MQDKKMTDLAEKDKNKEAVQNQEKWLDDCQFTLHEVGSFKNI